MRRLLGPIILALAVLGILWSCSKKSSPPPTAPTPTPVCELSATSLSFGGVNVGSSADRSFMLRNSGGGTLSGTMSESAAEFALVGTAAYSLTAGQSQSFTLRFSPASAGAKACTLSTGASICSQVVATGTGQTAAPVCNVQSTLLDFGSVNYSSSANRTISIQNAGGGTLSGAITGAGVDFHFLDPPSFSLSAGQWAYITLQFTPSSGGAQACTLKVSPGGCSPIVCRGTGVLTYGGDCQVRVISAPLDFGQVSVGSSADLPFTLKNYDTTYNADGAVSEACPEFEVVGSALFGLAPGGTQVRYARFTPTRPGPQSCAMPVSCTMNGAGTAGGVRDYVICTGVGVGGTPSCQASTTNLSAGTLHSGQVKDTTFVLTNGGSGTMAGSIHFIDTPPAPMSLIGTTTYSLVAGQSQTFTVRFTAPTVAAGHTESYVRQLDLGSPCQSLGYLTVQAAAVP
ncbi:MAG: choice-of-anchor D domain-containing protein [Candidatus Eisenbacteria bacterium]|nr:choice-of-anchor D domain-containing protein [Candidatus Eisenbacteria bacterium]